MRLALYCSFFWMFAARALGQEIPIDIVDRINAVDYIFEGTVIKSTPYKSANGRYIYTSNTIEISKILKGDITCGTIELIANGGLVDDLWVDPSHELKLRKDCSGIFLAKGTLKELSAIDFYNETNYQKIEATFQNQSFIKYWNDGVQWRASDVWATFQDIPEVYDLAELLTGLNFVDCGVKTFENRVVVPETIVTSEFDVNGHTLQERQEYARQQQANIAYNKAHFQLQGSRGGGPTVTYGLANMAITGSNPSYLEFDVNINDDAGTKYLYYGGVRLVYDTLVFGSNISQTTNMEVFSGDLVSDQDCYGFSYPTDLGSGDFLVNIIPTFDSQCKALVPNSPVQLFHVRMKMLNCLPNELVMADSAFDLGPSIVLYYSTYSETPDDQSFTEYSAAQAEQTLIVPGCGPAITSFSPTVVAGGIQQILEIQGHGFGATRGTGTVFFKNANDGGNSEIACDAGDFVIGSGWSDELIKIYVPSADTTLVSGTSVPPTPAGTGPFRVVTDAGISIPSNDSLTITYSVVSDNRFAPKRPGFLAPSENQNGRFIFHIDSLVATYQAGAMIPIIKKALREWSCLTGVDWIVADDAAYTTLQAPQADSMCVFKFADLGLTASGNQILAENHSILDICNGFFYNLESDILIGSDPGIVWFLDTIPTNPVPPGERDFYFAIIHELGHSHNMQHVNDPESIMYFANNSTGANRKIQLYGDTPAHDGGNWVMDNSVAHPPTVSSCYLSPISVADPGICDGAYSVGERVKQSLISLHPNPFVASFSLSSGIKKICGVLVFSVIGELVYRFEQSPSATSVVDLSNFGNGVYIVQVTLTDHTSVNVRVIKEE